MITALQSYAKRRTDAQISPTGTLYVVWSEFMTQEPYTSEMKMLRVGWDTPLSANPQPEVVGSPRDFGLAAYPNPFNATTKISFTLAKTGDVQLSVFDITGRRVKTLANEAMSAGAHAVMFEARELPSGIYLCHLKAISGRMTQKLVLLK